MKDTILKYQEKFKELPNLPIMGSYGQILDLMEDAIKRGKPLTNEEIQKGFLDEPIDLVSENA